MSIRVFHQNISSFPKRPSKKLSRSPKNFAPSNVAAPRRELCRPRLDTDPTGPSSVPRKNRYILNVFLVRQKTDARSRFRPFVRRTIVTGSSHATSRKIFGRRRHGPPDRVFENGWRRRVLELIFYPPTPLPVPVFRNGI